jgi:S1-C subfamily serine protease
MAEKPLYIRIRANVTGPYGLQQLRTLRDRGHFRSFHEVSEDRQTWRVAATVAELFPDGPRAEPISEASGPRDAQRPRPAERSPALLLLLVGSGVLLIGALVAVFGVVAAAHLRGEPDPEPGERLPDSSTAEGKVGRAEVRSLTTEEIVARCEGSVALVQGKRSRGSGFLVRPGVLVSNAHVIQNEFVEDLEVHFPSAPAAQKGPFRPTLLAKDRRRDLAFLGVKSDLAPLEMADGYQFKRGQDVTIIGSPGVGARVTLENAISRGVLSTRATVERQDYYQLSASINPGNSGGPVLDSAGKVVGVMSRKANDKEGLAFAIPWEDLHASVRSTESVKPGMADEATAVHRAEVVYRVLHAAALAYEAALEDVTKPARDLPEPLPADLEAQVSRVAADARLSASLRSNLSDLCVAVGQMKACAERPPPDADGLRARAADLKARHRKLADAIRIRLALD